MAKTGNEPYAVLFLTVKAGVRKERLYQNETGSWLLKISEPAVEGKANRAVVQFLTAVLKVPKSSIVIAKGWTNPHKKIHIHGISQSILEQLLQSFLKT